MNIKKSMERFNEDTQKILSGKKVEPETILVQLKNEDAILFRFMKNVAGEDMAMVIIKSGLKTLSQAVEKVVIKVIEDIEGSEEGVR